MVQFNLRASGAAAERTSCMLFDGSSPFQSWRTCSLYSSAESCKASQFSRATDAKKPPASLGDASVLRNVFRRVPLASFSNKGARPVTSAGSSRRAPVQSTSSAWRQKGGCSVGHIEGGEYFTSTSKGERPPSQEAPQQGPIYAHSSNPNRDEHV